MTFEFPLPPNLGNARMHWRTKHRAKKAYWKKLDELQLVGALPAPPKAPFSSVKASATVYVWSKNDGVDNLYTRFKYVWDWLVTRGYLVNDTSDNVQWSEQPKQIIDRKNRRVELTIEPYKAAA